MISGSPIGIGFDSLHISNFGPTFKSKSLIRILISLSRYMVFYIDDSFQLNMNKLRRICQARHGEACITILRVTEISTLP